MSFATWKASQGSGGASPKPVLSPSKGGTPSFSSFVAARHPETAPAATETPQIVQDSTSPYKLSGPTYLSQGKPIDDKTQWEDSNHVVHNVPLGFVGRAAKAAYNTARDTINGAVDRIDDFFGTLTAHGKLEDLEVNRDPKTGEIDYTKDTGLTLFMTPDQRKGYYDNLRVQEKPITKISKGGRAALGLANIGFLPVTSQLEAAKEVPLLKYPAEGVSWIFNKLGQGGSYVFNKGLDIAPLSDDEKTSLRPLVDELGAFIAQYAGIKAGFKLAETGGSAAIDRLPISEKSKTGIETVVKHGVGLSMTPFSHVYGVANGYLHDKIEQRKKDGIEITPEEGKKIVDEIKAEMPKVIDETKFDQAPQQNTPAETKPMSFKEWSDAGKPEVAQKEDLRTVMEGLSAGGYTKSDVVQIMKNLFDKNPLGDFSKTDVAAEAAKFTPEARPGTKTTVKDGSEITTKDGDLVSLIKVKPEIAREAAPETASKPAESSTVETAQGQETSKKAPSAIVERSGAPITLEEFKKGLDPKTFRDILTSSENKVSTEPSKDLKVKLEAIKDGSDTQSIFHKNVEDYFNKNIVESPKPVTNEADIKLSSSVFERLKRENPQLDGDVSYNELNLKKDAERAVELIATDKQKAYRIAMGAETSSEVTSTAVNIALAERARTEGNYSLYSRLVKNRSLEQTRRGQEIVSEKGSVTDNSTAKYVKELLATRLEAVGKKYLGDLGNIIRKTTDKGKAVKILDREVKKAQEKIADKKIDLSEAQKIIDKLAC